MAVAMEHHYREDRRGPGWGRPGPSHQDMGFFASAPQSQQQPYHHASLPPTGPRSHKRRKKHGHASSSGQGFQGNVHGGRRHYGKQRFMGPRGPANRRSWDWGQGFGSPRQFSHPRDMPPWSTGNMETPRSVWHAPAAPYNSNEDLARVHGKSPRPQLCLRCIADIALLHLQLTAERLAQFLCLLSGISELMSLLLRSNVRRCPDARLRGS